MSLSFRVSFLPVFLMLAAPASFAYDVLVSVSGSIYGNTCIVAADSKVISVPLGTIPAKQFSAAGDVGYITRPFTINLEECGPTYTGVKVTFSGAADSNNSDMLKNEAGSAQGIAIQLLDKDKNPLPLNVANANFGTTEDSRVHIAFYTRLIATQSAVTPGSISATATYTLEYQ